MKLTIKKACSYLALFAVLLQVSCSKEVFTKANENPNAPPTVTPGNILPGVETNLAYTEGGDIARYTSFSRSATSRGGWRNERNGRDETIRAR